jgi:hypothetical protein
MWMKLLRAVLNSGLNRTASAASTDRMGTSNTASALHIKSIRTDRFFGWHESCLESLARPDEHGPDLPPSPFSLKVGATLQRCAGPGLGGAAQLFVSQRLMLRCAAAIASGRVPIKSNATGGRSLGRIVKAHLLRPRRARTANSMPMYSTELPLIALHRYDLPAIEALEGR